MTDIAFISVIAELFLITVVIIPLMILNFIVLETIAFKRMSYRLE